MEKGRETSQVRNREMNESEPSFKVSKANLQDKTSLTKREMDRYGGNSVTGRISAGTEAA